MKHYESHNDYSEDDVPDGDCFRGLAWALIISALIWLLLLLPAIAHANPKYTGHDFLAWQSRYFDTKDITKLLPKNTALGTLHNTFGSNLAPIDTVLSSGKISFYRVHLLDGTCVQLRTCGRYSPLYKNSAIDFDYKARHRFRPLYKYLYNSTLAYCGLMTKYPDILFAISPVLEHRLSKDGWIKIASYVHRLCPKALIVNNSVYDSASSYDFGLIEKHDTSPKKPYDIISTDGTDILTINYKFWSKSTSSAFAQFVHSPSYNCRLGAEISEPRSRTKCLSVKTFKQIKERIK